MEVGGNSGGDTGDLQYITIASTGNTTDFGDCNRPTAAPASASNKTKGLFAGGSGRNDISQITIATTGNFSDFGDLGATNHFFAGCSSSHGGIA